MSVCTGQTSNMGSNFRPAAEVEVEARRHLLVMSVDMILQMSENQLCRAWMVTIILLSTHSLASCVVAAVRVSPVAVRV